MNLTLSSVITLISNTSFSDTEDDEPREKSLIALIFFWVRNCFIFFKCCAFMYKSAWTGHRYRKTHKSWC